MVGRETWKLSVKSVAEAIQAIEIQSERFFDVIQRLQDGGVAFHVLVNGEDTPDDDYFIMQSPDIRTIDIIPVIEGSSRNARIIVGIILIIVASYFTGGLAAYGTSGYTGGGIIGTSMGTFGTSMMTGVAMMGASLVAGGIAEMFAPTVENKSESGDKKESYLYSGAFNRVGAGGPIPVLYGCMYIGSTVINGKVNVSQGTVPYMIAAQMRGVEFVPHDSSAIATFEKARDDLLAEMYDYDIDDFPEGSAIPGHVYQPSVEIKRITSNGLSWEITVTSETADSTWSYWLKPYDESVENENVLYTLGTVERPTDNGEASDDLPNGYTASITLPQKDSTGLAQPHQIRIVSSHETLESSFPKDSALSAEVGLTIQGKDGKNWWDGSVLTKTEYPTFGYTITNVVAGSIDITVTYHDAVITGDLVAESRQRRGVTLDINQTTVVVPEDNMAFGYASMIPSKVTVKISSPEGFFEPVTVFRDYEMQNYYG